MHCAPASSEGCSLCCSSLNAGSSNMLTASSLKLNWLNPNLRQTLEVYEHGVLTHSSNN